jgi:phosphatidylserine/phosphatidylglycerophosphate/cardiolipin synthase-like enzyme
MPTANKKNHTMQMMKLNHIKEICLIAFILITACSQSAEKLPSQKSYECDSIKRNAAISLSKELEVLSKFTENKTGVYVLEDGGGSLVARAWFCEYAEKTIDIQYFIFSTDNVGLLACDFWSGRRTGV